MSWWPLALRKIRYPLCRRLPIPPSKSFKSWAAPPRKVTSVGFETRNVARDPKWDVCIQEAVIIRKLASCPFVFRLLLGEQVGPQFSAAALGLTKSDPSCRNLQILTKASRLWDEQFLLTDAVTVVQAPISLHLGGLPLPLFFGVLAYICIFLNPVFVWIKSLERQQGSDCQHSRCSISERNEQGSRIQM